MHQQCVQALSTHPLADLVFTVKDLVVLLPVLTVWHLGIKKGPDPVTAVRSLLPTAEKGGSRVVSNTNYQCPGIGGDTDSLGESSFMGEGCFDHNKLLKTYHYCMSDNRGGHSGS